MMTDAIACRHPVGPWMPVERVGRSLFVTLVGRAYCAARRAPAV